MRHSNPHSSHQRNGGVSLLFALLSLVALSLAALALVRSVDTSSLVLGNLGFKQDATAVSDRASRAAITWLTTTASNLDADSPADGYHASAHEDIDATGQQSTGSASHALVNWDIDNCAYASGTTGVTCTVNPVQTALTYDSNSARYVIFRLCSQTGSSTSSSNSCIRPVEEDTSESSKRGKLDYADSERFAKAPSKVYYRIVVRVKGARNTISYTETIVSI